MRQRTRPSRGQRGGTPHIRAPQHFSTYAVCVRRYVQIRTSGRGGLLTRTPPAVNSMNNVLARARLKATPSAEHVIDIETRLDALRSKAGLTNSTTVEQASERPDQLTADASTSRRFPLYMMCRNSDRGVAPRNIFVVSLLTARFVSFSAP